MERQQQEKQEFKRIQNHRAYSAINPTISDDNKNETKERVGMRRMQRRHSYDINYYKRELDHQAYPPSPPIIIASGTIASSNINTSSPSSQSPTSFLPPSSSSSKQTPHHNFQNFEATLGFSSSVLNPLPTYNNNNKNNNGNDDKDEFHLDDNNKYEEFNNSNNNNDDKDVTENFLFRREWDDEISKRKYKNKS